MAWLSSAFSLTFGFGFDWLLSWLRFAFGLACLFVSFGFWLGLAFGFYFGLAFGFAFLLLAWLFVGLGLWLGLAFILAWLGLSSLGMAWLGFWLGLALFLALLGFWLLFVFVIAWFYLGLVCFD